MASMNRGLNLPGIQRIMNDFEKESAMMDMKEDMMSEAVDDVMDQEEDEEEEGDKILKEVLDEIGVSLSHQVKSLPPLFFFNFMSNSFSLRTHPLGLPQLLHHSRVDNQLHLARRQDHILQDLVMRRLPVRVLAVGVCQMRMHYKPD